MAKEIQTFLDFPPSPYISAVLSTAVLEVAKLFAKLNGMVAMPLLFQTAAAAATLWLGWPVVAIEL
jgi:hypothetical protein